VGWHSGLPTAANHWAGRLTQQHDRVVSSREASLFASKLKVPYFETSAQDNVGVDPPFQYLATRMLNLYPKELIAFHDRKSPPSGDGTSSGKKMRCVVM